MEIDWKKVEGYAAEEARQFFASKTFRGILAMEGLAVAAFTKGVADGTQPLTLDALKGWLVLQAGLVIALLLRHTFAGIEAKLSFAPQVIVKAAEDVAQDKLLAQLPPTLAADVKGALAKPDPSAPSPGTPGVSS